jgi:hypothetical protein
MFIRCARLLCRLALAAAAPVSIGAPVATNIPEIPEAVWPGELPYSGKLPGVTPGLLMELGSGLRGDVRTAVAAITYLMPDPVVRRYRGSVAPAINVVAVDVHSGDVYEGSCLGQDRPPAVFDPDASPRQQPNGPAVGGFINVDLAAHLGLPPHATRYLVFAWLDEWTSRARLMDVPADPRRVVSSLRTPMNSGDAVKTQAAASGAAAGLSLVRSSAGALRAAWNLADPSTVVLLGYALEDRRLHWELLAQGRSPFAQAGSAAIDGQAFIGASRPTAKAFVLVGGGQVAAVLDGP